ncbi:MAG: lysophospholipid acyltransferase family protein [Oscillospiraceae bacterium]|nr:lysophospholipid acyltransferase family protein [Oscillospiraceae bacterium]
MNFLHCLVHYLVRVAMFVWHPVFRVQGRANIPEGGALFCSNHCGNADPLWFCFALGPQRKVRIMAKASLLQIPFIGRVLKWVGVFGVHRGSNDIAAIKTALSTLKNGERLLVYPEGTRVKESARIPAKTGAALFATRTDSLVVPVYIAPRHFPFTPVTLTFGAPYKMAQPGTKLTPEQLQDCTDALMEKIYALGEKHENQSC